MPHPYKTQLLQNLTQHYHTKNWTIKSNFQNGKDEILILLPVTQDTKIPHQNLYQELSQLPEIQHPPERTLISFCHPDGSHYCSKLINPSTQDQINLALLGQLPKRQLTIQEIQQL